MNNLNENNAVAETRIVIKTADYDKSVIFYRDLLGLTLLKEFASPGGKGIILDAGRATIEIADEKHAAYVDLLESGQVTSGKIRIAFGVDDSSSMTERLQGGDAEMIAGPMKTPWNSLNSRFRSPEDVQLTLFSDL